jgi:hypothetical protein
MSERRTPWQHLSRLEQSILAPKLIDLANKQTVDDSDLETAGELFNRIAVETAPEVMLSIPKRSRHTYSPLGT